MTFLAGVRMHGGVLKPFWIYDCKDFWQAVEKARALVEASAACRQEYPERPKHNGSSYDHLHPQALHEYKRACVRVDNHNAGLVAGLVTAIEWVKPWPFNESTHA